MTEKWRKGFADPAMANEFAAWLKTRPQCVQDLHKEFPIGSQFDIDGVVHYLLGWTEDDTLIVSPINFYGSAHDKATYDKARKAKVYVHAKHFRSDA